MAGEVIGINTAILTDTNAYAGVGFAMPSNTVVNVYNQLIAPEHRVARGSIGIMFNAQENPAISRVYGAGAGGVRFRMSRPEVRRSAPELKWATLSFRWMASQ